MAKVYALVNQKGGVCKTTTAINLASCLLSRGFKVLLLDLDPSRNMSSTIGTKEKKPDIYDVCVNGLPIKDAIVKTPFGDCVPGSDRLSTWDVLMPNNAFKKNFLVQECLAPVLDVYDYIILDTPPMLGGLSLASMVACDSVIIPSHADTYSMEGVMDLVKNIQTVKYYCRKDNLGIAGILITDDNPQTVMSREFKKNNQELVGKINTRLFQTSIRHNVTVSEAQAHGMPLQEYDPNCNGAKDYNDWTDELLKFEKNGGA